MVSRLIEGVNDVEGLRRMFLSADIATRCVAVSDPCRALPARGMTLHSAGRVRSVKPVPAPLWNSTQSVVRSDVPPPRPLPKRPVVLEPLFPKVMALARRNMSPFLKPTGVGSERLASLRNNHPTCTTSQLLDFHTHIAQLANSRKSVPRRSRDLPPVSPDRAGAAAAGVGMAEPEETDSLLRSKKSVRILDPACDETGSGGAASPGRKIVFPGRCDKERCSDTSEGGDSGDSVADPPAPSAQ